MGCDIHASSEILVNNMWHHYSVLNIGRHYDLFARMANVRNNGGIVPISEPRGIPNDITFITWLDYTRWGEDGHSHSWLSGKEVDELEVWYNEYRKKYKDYDRFFFDDFGYIFGNGYDIQSDPGAYPKGVQDSRMIFWFDN